MTGTVDEMANQDDVRRIAMALPGATESKDRFAFSVDHKGKPKGFVWLWLERTDPKKARVPQPNVLAVRMADQTDKAALLAADPEKFFTEPHYNGYPAVLVRLPTVTKAELRQVITEAWRCLAPKPVVTTYDAHDSSPASKPARPNKRTPMAKLRAPSRHQGQTDGEAKATVATQGQIDGEAERTIQGRACDGAEAPLIERRRVPHSGGDARLSPRVSACPAAT